MSFLFEIKNADVFRNHKKVLNQFSFSLKEGGHTVIFGPNGSGKSTFLKLLTRDLKPAYSKNSWIKIKGKSLPNLFDLRKQIGIISSDLEYNFSGKNITGNAVVLSAFTGGMGVFRSDDVNKEQEEKVQKIFSFLEIPFLQNKNFDEMSSGEKKKVLLARALVNEPHTLILDEPTNALDMVAQKNFMNIIRKIARENTTTIVLVTHHLSEIFPEAKKGLMIKNGEIFKQGLPEKIFTPENFNSLFEHEIL
jgi:iron complex transport system ATP-binding protein